MSNDQTRVAMIITPAAISHEGGSGKSATAVGLGYGLARRNFEALFRPGRAALWRRYVNGACSGRHAGRGILDVWDVISKTGLRAVRVEMLLPTLDLDHQGQRPDRPARDAACAGPRLRRAERESA